MAKQWVEARKTICIDWNGVLDMYMGWRGPGHTYPPRPGARDFLKTLKQHGYEVVIFTAADPDVLRRWLGQYGLDQYVDWVTDEKVPALVYLDDRAVQFQGNFADALHQILSFKTYWETPQSHEGGKL